MLQIYNKLFNELEKQKIDYCLYKGFDHLEDDLNGNRENGDLDIFLDGKYEKKFTEIMQEMGFYKKTRLNANSYICLDKETGKFALLDVATQANLSGNKFFPVFCDIDFDSLKIDFHPR